MPIRASRTTIFPSSFVNWFMDFFPRTRVGVAAAFFALAAAPLCAQHHNASPPTAPAKPVPIVIESSGMGPMQFVTVNYGVPAPQSLTRQLRGDDDRTRAAALSALGVPAQYLQRGRTTAPHSIDLVFAQLGNDDDVDAIVTVELDQHIVSAILVPDGDNWRRIATIWFADPFNDLLNTSTTFLRTERSLLAHNRYRAVFRARSTDAHSGMTEYEAHVIIVNKQAVVTLSFASRERDCSADVKTPDVKAQAKSTTAGACSLAVRWLRQDTVEAHHLTLITGTGRVTPHDESSMTLAPMDDPLEDSHLRSFTCQSLMFNDQTEHFEPTAAPAPCFGK